MTQDSQEFAAALVAFFTKAVNAPQPPEIPKEFSFIPGLEALWNQLRTLQMILESFSRGDFSPEIRLRGSAAGKLKTLQANLLHLCWQIQQVSKGDFSQRVDFMGEFSLAFNSMVEQLSSALDALRRKEEESSRLTVALQQEVLEKAEALAALSKSEARFRYMAEHDALTGVCNRRSFYDLVVMDLEKARKDNRPCILILFDIDKFKTFNDTYGHLEGDTALKHVASTLKNQLREGDILGRYGGEEFVVFLPDVPRESAWSTADRLREAMAATPVPTKNFGFVTVTISLGVVAVAGNGREERKTPFLEHLLAHADESLYEAKEAGRNRVVLSPYV